MATYDLSGKPFRIKLVWPKFNLDERAEVRTRAEAIDAIAEELSRQGEMYNKKLNVLHTELVYRYDAEKSIFDPTLIVRTEKVNQMSMPIMIVYSITKGLLKKNS